jgi:hypothetical protein
MGPRHFSLSDPTATSGIVSAQRHNEAKLSTELTPKSSTKAIVLVLVVVLVLEWAGKIGAEQSCQLIYNAVS